MWVRKRWVTQMPIGSFWHAVTVLQGSIIAAETARDVYSGYSRFTIGAQTRGCNHANPSDGSGAVRQICALSRQTSCETWALLSTLPKWEISTPAAKPLQGFGGAGVLEIVEDDDGNTYRAVYTVRFAEVVYVLHAFQKKAKRGIQTPKREIDRIKRRLKRAEEDYHEWQKSKEGNDASKE